MHIKFSPRFPHQNLSRINENRHITIKSKCQIFKQTHDCIHIKLTPIAKKSNAVYTFDFIDNPRQIPGNTLRTRDHPEGCCICFLWHICNYFPIMVFSCVNFACLPFRVSIPGDNALLSFYKGLTSMFWHLNNKMNIHWFGIQPGTN